MDTEEKEMCMNCKRDISCANYQMHTAHCARHITLCQKCDEPIPKKEFPDHRCGGGPSVPEQTITSGADEPPPKPKPRADKKSVGIYIHTKNITKFCMSNLALTHQIIVIGQIVGNKAQTIAS